MKKATDIILGNKVRDEVTEVEGIATSKIEYINGCTQFGLQRPVDKDGKVPDIMWFDYQRLVVIGPGLATRVQSSDTGFDAAPKMGDYRG